MPSRTKPSKTPILVALALIVIVGMIALISSLRNAAMRHAAHSLPNPTIATPDVLAAAKTSYNEHCASCHGSNGDGKGDKAAGLWSKPTDFQRAMAMKSRTDGDLYWVTTKGSWPMPAFEDKLTDLERWQLVTYIRTFAAPEGPPMPAR